MLIQSDGLTPHLRRELLKSKSIEIFFFAVLSCFLFLLSRHHSGHFLCYQVETTRKIISFHKEDKSLDANNIGPQSILLDFISSSQTLRIWSFNTSIREHLNSDQLQKGKQIEEWWKQMTKGTCLLWKYHCGFGI